MNAKQVSMRDAARLGCYALVTGLALLLANRFTASTIHRNELQHLNATLTEVLPDSYIDNMLQDKKVVIPDKNRDQSLTVYRGYLNQKPSAVVIQTTAPEGYSGSIDLLIGLTYDGVVTGVRVVKHTETPGLGDDIEIKKSDWILSFNGKGINSPVNWKVKRDGGDFDQFTGATITPRAVVHEVHQTVEWYKEHRQQIFDRQ